MTEGGRATRFGIWHLAFGIRLDPLECRRLAFAAPERSCVTVLLQQPATGAPVVQRAHVGATLHETARAGVLYLALTLLLTWPLSLHPASTAAPGDPDTDLFVWTLAWNTHALTSHPLALFDANIYHPHPRTLAFSENLAGSTLFAAPVLWLTGNHVLALNTVVLSAVVLCGLGAFVLARWLGLPFHAALLCGLVFAFAPARFLRFGQIHLATVQWIPFCLAYLHAYLDGRQRRHLGLAVGFFSLQALTSGHGASFLAVAILVVVGYRILMGEPVAPLKRAHDASLVGALLLLPTLALYVPYRAVQVEHGLQRSLDDWPATWVSFLASPTNVHRALTSLLPDIGIYEHATAFMFPGILPLVLAAAALLWWRRRPADAQVLAPGTPPPAPARPRARTSARLAALTLEALALAALVIAAIVYVDGPIRWRVEGEVLFTARRAERALLAAALLLLTRIALAPWVPLAPLARLARLRRTWLAWAAPHRQSVRAPYALLALTSFSLAAGPPISIWPYVYQLPGLSFIRMPSRFVILGVLALGVLAAIGSRASQPAPRRGAHASSPPSPAPSSSSSSPRSPSPGSAPTASTSPTPTAGSPPARARSRSPSSPSTATASACRAPTCCTRWRTGRRRCTATAACARRCTSSCTAPCGPSPTN
jgi:hypothetical protein